MDHLTKIAELLIKVIEIKPRYYFMFWVLGLLLSFLPIEIKTQLGVSVPEPIQPWLGLATLAAFVFWVVLMIIGFVQWADRKLQLKRGKRNTLRHLDTLSQGERDILLHCLVKRQRTACLPLDDRHASSLRAKHLLRASPGSALAMPHTIPNFVWNHMTKNELDIFPELLDDSLLAKMDEALRNSWMLR